MVLNLLLPLPSIVSSHLSPYIAIRYSCAAADQNSSATVPGRCTIKPNFTTTILHRGGEQAITGTGTLYAYSGRHLFPSRIGEPNLHHNLYSTFVNSPLTHRTLRLIIRGQQY